MLVLPLAADQIIPNRSTLSTLSSLVSLFFFLSLSLFPQCDWGGVVWGHRRQRVLQWSWRKVGSPIYCCCGYCAAACSEQVTLTHTHTLTSDSKAQREDDPFCAEKLRSFKDGGAAEPTGATEKRIHLASVGPSFLVHHFCSTNSTANKWQTLRFFLNRFLKVETLVAQKLHNLNSVFRNQQRVCKSLRDFESKLKPQASNTNTLQQISVF